MDDPILEKRLKHMFESRAGELPNESVREARIRRNVYEKIESEENYMKKGFMKKAVVAVAAICVFGSMTAFAIGKIVGITSHTDVRDKVHTYEQALELQKENGLMVDFPEKFSNGYTFKSAVPVSYETEDKDGNKLGNGTQLSVTYGKDGMEDVTFSAEVGTYGELTPAAVKTCEDGTELRFYKMTNKFVPADYKITEEDKKAQEDGNFNLAYGSDKIEVMTSCTVEWNMAGQGYSLFKFGEDLGADEMFVMAEEIIAGQNQ